MMSSHDEKTAVTSAIRVLRAENISFEPHLYRYEDHGGTTRAAEYLNISEHAVIKTLVMETELRQPILVLMHGDCEVSTKQLARTIGANRVTPCDEHTAQKHTGYVVGGISPFGTRTKLPVYAEESIFDLPIIYINGGKRGFLVSINPSDLKHSLHAIPVRAAIQTAP